MPCNHILSNHNRRPSSRLANQALKLEIDFSVTSSLGSGVGNLVYRQVSQVTYILHAEPSLDAFSLRSDVISSIKMHSPCGAVAGGLDFKKC